MYVAGALGLGGLVVAINWVKVGVVDLFKVLRLTIVKWLEMLDSQYLYDYGTVLCAILRSVDVQDLNKQSLLKGSSTKMM